MPFGPTGKEASSGAETLRGDGLQIVKGEGNNLGAEWIGFRLGLFFGGDEISVGIEIQATRSWSPLHRSKTAAASPRNPLDVTCAQGRRPNTERQSHGALTNPS